jgi:hypothetical protein
MAGPALESMLTTPPTAPKQTGPYLAPTRVATGRMVEAAAFRVSVWVLAIALSMAGGVYLAAPAAGAVRAPRVTFYFGLKRPEARARAAFFAVQQPGSRT